MSTKILIGVVVTIVIVAAIYFFMGPCKGDKDLVEPVDTVCTDKAPETHVVKVELVKGTWKVFYKNEDKSAELHVCPGDKIVWEAEDTDIYLQFYEESLFGSFKISGLSNVNVGVITQPEDSTDFSNLKMDDQVRSKVDTRLPGMKLELQVRPDAKRGRYYYSIFCTGESAGYAEQDSPPVIIID